MKSRAIFILCTFIILLGINKISLHKDIKKQNDDISVVNLSGKQRMYSQKITKLIFIDGKYKNSLTNGINSAELKRTVKKFSESHQELKEKYQQKYEDTYLDELFSSLESHYLKIITNANLLVNNNQKNVDTCLDEIKSGSDQFLPIMDDIVNQYVLIGKKRGEMIISREFTFNIILVLLSIYGVFFLIIPLVNSNKKGLE